jgi:hypothetical protein
MSDDKAPPQIPPRGSLERIQNLEMINQDLRNKNQTYEHENSYYKEYCKQLESQISKIRTTAFDDDNNSITAINDPFVDIAATSLCADIENCLEETNKRLTDENQIKASFEFMITKLSNLVTFQYNSKDSLQLTRLKDELIKKMSIIDDKIQKSIVNEKRIAEIERAYDRLNVELGAVRTAYGCKQMVDSSQIDALTSEFMKWKEEIKAVYLKVQDQNSLIKELTEKCKPLLEEKNNQNNTPSSVVANFLKQENDSFNETIIIELPANETPKPLEINDQANNNHSTSPPVSPGTSPNVGFANLIRSMTRNNSNDDRFQSYTFINNELNTIRPDHTLIPKTDERYDSSTNQNNTNTNINNNSHETNSTDDESKESLKIYQCPICNVTVEKESFPFEGFLEHVNKCDSDSLTCIFCLKLFKKTDSNSYVKHVQEHE